MATKIVKTDDAPEGKIEVVYAGGEFTVDGRGHKTDDPAAIAAAQTSPYLAVEADDAVDEAAAKKEADARDQRRIAADKAQDALVSKSLHEPAPEVAIEPVQETKETDE